MYRNLYSSSQEPPVVCGDFRIYSEVSNSMALIPILLSTLFFPTPDYIFVGGLEGYNCYRIPAVIVVPSGDVLAFAEGRKNSCSDTGDIDLVYKRSTDQGRTWSTLELLWDKDEHTVGNPAPVVDSETGTLFLLVTHNLGTDHEREIIAQTSTDTRRVFVLSSMDNGHTWTKPKEITQDVKQPGWTWYATGPGSGIQLTRGPHKGRLMVACDHIEASTKHYYSHVIYSDDHGETWQLGGTTPQHQVNESEVAELSDGRLLLNMRNYTPSERYRKIAHSSDGGMTWSNLIADSTLIEPICQASLQRFSFAEEGQNVLLFSNPASQVRRERMTLRASFDDGITWPASLVVHESMSAYSDIVRLPDDVIGLLYEAGPHHENSYYGIAFARIALSELK